MEPGSGYHYVNVGAVGGGDEPLDLTLPLPLLPISTSSPSVHYSSCEWIDFVLEAQKLQQSAAALDESEVATKALLCLEGAMYLILTGMSMEKSPNLDSKALKMYVDTLDLIGDIGSVFHTELGPLEAIFVVLTTRCQSLLLLKLFQFNTRLGTNVVWYINDYLQRCPVPKIVPRSQSSGEGPPEIMAEIPYQLYEDFNKVFATQMALLNAQELWERADQLASHHGIEETFKQLDIQCGPLTFKSPLVDLVRYVKEAAQMLKPSLAGTRKRAQRRRKAKSSKGKET